MLRTLAQYCGSTALALSMHQHLIAATVWKYRRGQGGEPMLKNIAEKQLVLVSTGAGDSLESNGSSTKTDGGYLVLRCARSIARQRTRVRLRLSVFARLAY